MNQEPKKPSRQLKREMIRQQQLLHMLLNYGGYSERGGHYWPPELPRRIARRIAFDRARRILKGDVI